MSCLIRIPISCISINAGDKKLIICESLQILETGQKIGMNCLDLGLEQLLTTESVYQFLGVQWSIYTLILAYKWSVYGLNKVKI